MSKKVLEGIRVLDFTEVYLGPSCTQVLGDFGADVIKIERANGGDRTRNSVPDPDGLDNPIFLSVNRNKRSICIDTRAPDGRAAVHELVRGVDVVVSNFRAGVMERLGFGYDDLRQVNSSIIWASATGFGEQGPYRHKGGQDVLAQAYTGLMFRRPTDDVPLHVNPTGLCDYTSGNHLDQGILLALFHRERTGEGQRVEVRMYDSMLHTQMQEACTLLNRGFEINWGAMPLTGVFATSDGALCLVGGFHRQPLEALTAALGLEDELVGREEFSSHDSMMQNRPALQAILAERFKSRSTGYWIGRLEEQDLLCAPVRSLEEALQDEQTRVNQMVMQVDHPVVGSFATLAAPVHLSATPAVPSHPPPTLGQHTDQVLGEAGLEPSAIERLRESGIAK